MSHVHLIRPEEGLPFEIGASIFGVANLVWPPESPTAGPDLVRTLDRWKAQNSTHCVVLHEGSPNNVLAHALIFRRDMITSQGVLPVGALATVFVHPAYRGYGWGADVVRAALSVLPEMGVEVALFQTGVPEFYEKLGGRLVNNRFFNGLKPNDPGNPFWDTVEMIYPANFSWPEGDIDLNGEGY